MKCSPRCWMFVSSLVGQSVRGYGLWGLPCNHWFMHLWIHDLVASFGHGGDMKQGQIGGVGHVGVCLWRVYLLCSQLCFLPTTCEQPSLRQFPLPWCLAYFKCKDMDQATGGLKQWTEIINSSFRLPMFSILSQWRKTVILCICVSCNKVCIFHKKKKIREVTIWWEMRNCHKQLSPN